MRKLAATILLCALALTACRTPAPGRGLYQWADADGNVRFTSSPGEVPRAARATLARVEPGRSADENAALLPGALTQPRPEKTAAEWLRGEAEAAAQAADPAAKVSGEELVPPTPAEAAEIDAKILTLESQIADAEVELTQRTSVPAVNGEVPNAADVKETADRLHGLQAELAALRERRALAADAH